MRRSASVEKLELLFTLALAGCGLLAGGCSHYQPYRPPGESKPPCPRREEPCPDWRWIGITKGYGTCPELPGWDVRPLFATPARGAAVAPPARQRQAQARASERPRETETKLPPGLSRFCLYEHPGAGADLSRKKLGLEAIGRDCMVVFPAGSSIVTAGLADFQDHFLRQAAGKAISPPPAGAPRVRLALLDTAPTAKDPAENPTNHSPHGYTLAHMAKKLGCAGPSCVADVTARLALPWVVYDPSSSGLSLRDDVHGGFVGTIGELAEAIRGEVVDWQAVGGSQSLLLNLSVGWNPFFGGLEADVSAMPAAVQAVHAALVDALCRGVPAVAAAGNLTWGPDPDLSRGPLLPAAWERLAAPDQPTCEAALESPAAVVLKNPSASTRPLITAVGAVRADGQPLGNARLAAEPRVVAFGDHAVLARHGGVATAMLTGSSVSTLVTSAALAWVRAYRQDLDALEAVEALYQSGEPGGLGERRADVCLGMKGAEPCPEANGPRVRRTYVVKAAAEACATCQGPGCSVPCPQWGGADLAAAPQVVDVEYETECRPEWTVRLDRLRASAPQTSNACPPAEWLEALRDDARPAAPERFHGRRAASTRACPHWQLVATNLSATTGPQPGSDPCPACGLGGGGGGPGGMAAVGLPAGATPWTANPAAAQLAGPATATVYLEIDDTYLGELSSPVLKIGDDTYSLAAVWPSLRPGAKLCVEGVRDRPGAALQLSFEVNGTRSATSVLQRTK